jgi:hypothetical protein
VDVDNVTDISESHDASIFMGQVCNVDSLRFCVCVDLFLKNGGGGVLLEVRGNWDDKQRNLSRERTPQSRCERFGEEKILDPTGTRNPTSP